MENIGDRNWDVLLDAIEQGLVVPILGNEFLRVAAADGMMLGNRPLNGMPLNEYVVRKLAEKFNVSYIENMGYTPLDSKIKDFNKRNYLDNRRNDITDIYYEISQIVKNVSLQKNELLDIILSINNFPLIMTTSFVDSIERELLKRKQEIDVVVYDKSLQADIKLRDGLSCRKDTLYYIFGKMSKIKSSYMVTEDDFLEYLHYWHNVETRPRCLSQYLSNKFFLILGCNYPDWIFRFLWYSVKNFSLAVGDESAYQGLVANATIDADTELKNFLFRIQLLVSNDMGAFVKELDRRWREYRMSQSDDVLNQSSSVYRINEKEDEYDIFVSYASEDYKVVVKIVEELEKNGARVWFDKQQLYSSVKFEPEIQRIITKKSKKFMPVLSVHTLQSDRFFRTEWKNGIEKSSYYFGSMVQFIAPVVIDEININSRDIPNEFRNVHLLDWRKDSFRSDVISLIRSMREK